MPGNNLLDLFENDREALAHFRSLPMFIQDRIMRENGDIRTREELGAAANNAMSDGLSLEQYKPIFEDDSSSPNDF